MLKIICSFFLAIQLQAFHYYVCLDGGGTKTSLQILDQNGLPLFLERENEAAYTLHGPSSNINVIGVDGFRRALDHLFDSLKVGGVPFSNICSDCQLIAGYAGLGNASNQEKAKAIFQEKGFFLDEAIVVSDAKLALELLDGNGIVLIAGTGSIALGIQEDKEIRAGGFGPLLGDEGSGYSMGIQAIKAALEEEFGYGSTTQLTSQIKDRYHVEEVRDLIPRIHSAEISRAEIAALVPIIFNLAETGDRVSFEIMTRAANELISLVMHVLRRMDVSKSIPVILVGGLFQTDSSFTRLIFQSHSLPNAVMLLDYSGRNLASEVARKQYFLQ